MLINETIQEKYVAGTTEDGENEIIRTDCSIKSSPPHLFQFYQIATNFSSHAHLLKLGCSSPLRMKAERSDTERLFSEKYSSSDNGRVH